MAPSWVPRGAAQVRHCSTARCYGVPGGLPHGEALDRAAGHGAGRVLVPATLAGQRGAGDVCHAPGSTAALVPCDPLWGARLPMTTVHLVGHVARAPTVRGAAVHPRVPFPWP
jgi:hypothetical protein